MNILTRFLSHPLSNKKFDASLPRWVSIPVGLAIFVVVAATFPQQANSQAELCLGLGLAFLSFLLFSLFGTTLGWLEELLLKKPLLNRHRIGEYLGYGSFFVIFSGGLWGLSTLPLARPGFMIGILLLLCVTLAAMCLGILSSLMRVGRESA